MHNSPQTFDFPLLQLHRSLATTASIWATVREGLVPGGAPCKCSSKQLQLRIYSLAIFLCATQSTDYICI